MRGYGVIAVAVCCALGALAQPPAWLDGFEKGKLADYLQGVVPKSATLEKVGPDGSMALRLAPGMKTEVMLKEFPVEPGVKYRLTFAARTLGPDVLGKNPATETLFFAADKVARGLLLPWWEIRVVNAQGQVPFAGHFKSFWQYACQGEWTTYRQSFYPPADGRKVQVLFCNPGGQNTLLVDAVTLEKSTEANLLTSGESFTGLLDYAGWSELSKARIIEKDGKFLLKVDPNGYALTDPIPVQVGDYRVVGKKPNATAFFYDADMRRIGVNGWAGAKFTALPGCAFVQLYFGPGEIEGVTVTPAAEVKK